jgi:hypothetical protein
MVNRVRGGKNRPSKAKESNFARSVRFDAKRLVPDHTNDVRVVEARTYFECFTVEERYDPVKDEVVEHDVIDRSLTKRQHLRILRPDQFDVVTLRTRQLDKADPRKERMIPTTDQKFIKTVDNKTLLRRERPYERSVDTLYRETKGDRGRMVRLEKDSILPNAPRVHKPGGIVIDASEINL